MREVKINWRCRWCGVRQGLLRALTRRRYCSGCAFRMNGSAGLYLQAGGPPCPMMDRADDHHAPREILDVRTDRPARQAWWRRALCQCCWHLDPVDGSYCCECGGAARGLPLSPCVPCDEGAQRR